MARISACLFTCFVFVVSVFASPTFRKAKTVMQIDGTSLTLTSSGDEQLHYYLTADSVPVLQDEIGGYCYACWNVSGELVSSHVAAHEFAQRVTGENQQAEYFKNAFFERLNKVMAAQRYGIGRIDLASINSFGTPNLPVILVQFSDVKFSKKDAVGIDCDSAFFDAHFNGVNLNDEFHKGSVSDYFVAQSDGQFVPHFDIIGPVTVNKKQSDYGANSGSHDGHAANLLGDAVAAAVSQGVDFSKYANRNNAVPFVGIIYAGEGEQVSQNKDNIWAQYFPSIYYTHRNMSFRSVLMVNEIANYGKGMKPDGIGTFCHEFSHALSLPDMYSDKAFGLDLWDIMDYGQYWNIAKSPVGYSAYERSYLGWIVPDTLATDRKQRVVINTLGETTGKRAYYIINPSHTDEFYVLENRQPSMWFPEELGRGMLVTHIDYDVDRWMQNAVNSSTTRPNISIIPADNELTKHSADKTYVSYQGDLFPGYLNNTSLTDDTEPADVVYYGGMMHVALNDIFLDDDNNVVFAFMADGLLNKPTNLAVSFNGEDRLVAAWDAIANADAYELTLTAREENSNDETVACDTVNETTFVLPEMQKPANCRLAVRAIAEKYVGSDTAMVAFKAEPTSAKALLHQWGKDADVQIYDAQGVLVAEGGLAASLKACVKPGAYVVRRGNVSKQLMINKR